MKLTKEQKAALILGGREVIDAEIERRHALLRKLVGTLYPQVVREEINELYALRDQVAR